MRTTIRQLKNAPRGSNVPSFAAVFAGEIETVNGYWLTGDDWSFERWDLAPGTLLVNPRDKLIRFGLRAVGSDTSHPFEAIIRHNAKGWVFKADRWHEANTEYPLQVFESAHSVLFVFNGKTDRIYPHMERAD